MSKLRIKTNYYVSLCSYTLKKLGFMNEPVDREYEDYSLQLSRLGKDFKFCAPLAGGPIFTLVYQIPGYLSPTKKEDLKQIEKMLIQFVEQRSPKHFIQQFPSKTNYFESWYQEGWMNHLFKPIEHNPSQVKKAIHLFMEVLTKTWNQYRPIFNKKISDIDILQLQKDLGIIKPFERWENHLNTTYPYDEFVFVMCPETFSTASSLGPEKVVISSNHTLEVMKNALLHEIGVRWMDLPTLNSHRQTSSKMANDYIGMILLIETEVCYRKPKIYPELKEDYFIPGMQLEALVKWRKRQSISTISPSEFSTLYNLAKQEHLI